MSCHCPPLPAGSALPRMEKESSRLQHSRCGSPGRFRGAPCTLKGTKSHPAGAQGMCLCPWQCQAPPDMRLGRESSAKVFNKQKPLSQPLCDPRALSLLVTARGGPASPLKAATCPSPEVLGPGRAGAVSCVTPEIPCEHRQQILQPKPLAEFSLVSK